MSKKKVLLRGVFINRDTNGEGVLKVGTTLIRVSTVMGILYWEIEHAASKGKRIVGVYLQGESDSEIPEALNKYGNSLQKWNGESIISGITGDNTWNGPGRNWATERVTC